MPTYRQAHFLPRALESLKAQTVDDWELIIIDDGSDDDTQHVIEPYVADRRIRYHRLERNRGLGNALNLATSLARGRYIAYLPSDDCYYPEHLIRLSALLDSRSDIYLAYGGVHWTAPSPQPGESWNSWMFWISECRAPTLQGEEGVDAEMEVLERVRRQPDDNNLLALVQVMHRRSLEDGHRWTAREEEVSDRLEPDFWWGLLSRGARFAYAGAITAEWVTHPDSRHHIICDRSRGGLSRYRQHYRIPQGEALNWQPSKGFTIDERLTYSHWRQQRELPTPGGLKILLVGELSFNPDRIVALEEHGHKLYGLWSPAERWDTASSTAYGNIETIPTDSRWRDRVREIRPDVIYALLNWQALPLIEEAIEADLGIPIAFHFKEAPFFCFQRGLWPTLMRALRESDGQLLINEESLEWYQIATDGMLEPDHVLIMDGDLPKRDWMTDDWSPKLSAKDGEIHTMCAGRPVGLDPREGPRSAELVSAILKARIHLHMYGGPVFRDAPPEFLAQFESTGLVHWHPMVNPQDWARELSQYDAAWNHILPSTNGGDIRRGEWADFNLPGRLGTYMAAGLPWLLQDNRNARVAINRIARSHDIGIFFDSADDLAAQLRDRKRLQQLTDNVRRVRHSFSFDAHVPPLIEFFHRLIERRQR